MLEMYNTQDMMVILRQLTATYWSAWVFLGVPLGGGLQSQSGYTLITLGTSFEWYNHGSLIVTIHHLAIGSTIIGYSGYLN